jgi:dipeptidyl aminopeptidase/acylaminoacyl peptidase
MEVPMGEIRTTALAAALAAMLGGTALAAPIAGPPRAITDPRTIESPQRPASGPVPIPDLYFTRSALGDAAWSPDGRWVVMSTNLTGRYNLWKVAAEGGWPIQLTVSDDRQAAVTVSPDGQWAVYQSDHGGDEMWDLYAVPMNGGPAVNLTKTPDVAETNPRFSPDGKTIALNRKPKASPVNDIALMEVTTHQVRPLTREASPEFQWDSVDWTADGAAIIANRRDTLGTRGGVWRVAVADGSVTPLTPPKAKGLVWASDLSPDGSLLAITSNEKGGLNQAAILDLAGGKSRWIAGSAWEQTAGGFSPDGRTMLVETNLDGRLELAAADVTGAGVAKLPLPEGFNSEGAGHGRSYTPDGRLLVGHDAGNTPFDYWILDRGGKASQLTNFSLASLDPAGLPASQIVSYRSFDGTVISAVMLLPLNLKRDGTAPAVVVPHGGPTGQTLDRFSRQAIALASRGYVVIQPNVRGSTGYGEVFQKANIKDLGGGDLQDEVYAAKFLVDTGYVNPKKIGITGGSYGGFMTLMAVGRTPDVWAAGVSQYGIINWYEMLKHEDPLLQQYQRGLIGDPVTDKAVYDKASPMTYIRNTRAPLLVLQGENDIRVPRGQAAEVVETLKSVGATVDVKFYPAEGHGFVKRENQIDALQRTIDWFDKYLK